MLSEAALARVDHLVFAAPDLDAGIAAVEVLLGVAASPGGRHPDFGTRNALIGLGPGRYLEIVGPDPDRAGPGLPRLFGLDQRDVAGLAGWAAKSCALGDLAGIDRGDGVALGPVARGRRVRPDGVRLEWSFTDPQTVSHDGLVPFFIDWGDSPHPADGLPGAARLVDLRAETPHPDAVRRAYASLGLDLRVVRGNRAALVASIETARGPVELRGAASRARRATLRYREPRLDHRGVRG